jgi:heme-degrading monooxygenase HmoA
MKETGMQTPYSSGNWIVTSGHEKEFVERWTEFLEWTRSSYAELQTAQLIQDHADPRHFISFARWDSADALNQWRSRPEFATKLGACRALCDDFRGSDFALAAAV